MLTVYRTSMPMQRPRGNWGPFFQHVVLGLEPKVSCLPGKCSAQNHTIGSMISLKGRGLGCFPSQRVSVHPPDPGKMPGVCLLLPPRWGRHSVFPWISVAGTSHVPKPTPN
jgi:hypothetical protein